VSARLFRARSRPELNHGRDQESERGVATRRRHNPVTRSPGTEEQRTDGQPIENWRADRRSIDWTSWFPVPCVDVLGQRWRIVARLRVPCTGMVRHLVLL
jgi:hypothetical protein